MAKADLKPNPVAGRSSRVGNYQSRNMVGSITAALLLVGAFALFAQHTNRYTKLIQSGIEIQILLQNELSEQDSLRVVQFLTAQPFVVKDAKGAPRIRYVSKDEAFQKLKEDLKEDISAYTVGNPLRSYFLINIKPEYHNQEKLAQIKADFEQEDGIFEVSYAITSIEQLAKSIHTIGIIVFALTSLLVLLTGVFVHNAIRLALYSQRFIIRSMQLVGATDNFIKKPYIIRAGLYGLMSGILANALLTGALLLLYQIAPEFKQVADWPSTLLIFLSLLLIGALVAAVSALIAIGKYLNRSLDELYQR
ncbi:cell division protein FtsX [Rhodoflexus sp.]